MDNRSDGLWQGGPWEQPARPFSPPPAVVIPPQKYRPPRPPQRRHSGRIGFLIALALIVSLTALAVLFNGGLAPRSADPVPSGSDPGYSSWEQEEDLSAPPSIPQAETGTGVILSITPPSGEALTYTQVYEKAAPSIAALTAYSAGMVSTGTGIVLTADGYIVTNNHVVEGADKLDITLNDNRSFNGKIIGTDPSTDLALVKIDATDLPIVKFGDSDNLKIGEWVLAVGNPLGLTSTVTAGIVSAKARVLSNTRKMGIESFIQTDAAVNPGNSGGALVNTDGELVGINTAIYSETGSYTGYSFAVPTSIVSKVVTDLKQYGAVQRAVLGISFMEINAEVAKEKNIEVQDGVYVAEVNNLSAAMEAGMEEGDILTEVNGVKIKNGSSLQEQISRYRPGDKIKVKVLRGKQTKTLDLTLKNSQGNTEVTKLSGMDSLGAGFKELNDKDKRELNVRYGVQVIGIKNGKLKSAGIRDGFVILEINNKSIKSVSDVEQLYDAIVKSNNPVHLAENCEIFSFTIEDEDVQTLRKLNRGKRVFQDPDEYYI